MYNSSCKCLCKMPWIENVNLCFDHFWVARIFLYAYRKNVDIFNHSTFQPTRGVYVQFFGNYIELFWCWNFCSLLPTTLSVFCQRWLCFLLYHSPYYTETLNCMSKEHYLRIDNNFFLGWWGNAMQNFGHAQNNYMAEYALR